MKTNCNNRILVIDDEEFCLTGLKVILHTLGVDVNERVDLAICAKDALEFIKSANTLGIKYNLILTDIQMPDINGIEFTRQARQLFKAQNL